MSRFARHHRETVRSWALPAFIAACAVLAAATTLSESVRLYTPLPRSDQWRFVSDLRDVMNGFRPQDLLAQQNENRPALPRLVHLVDAWLLGGRNLLPLATTLLAQLGNLALLASLMSAATEERDSRPPRWMLPIAFTALLFFSAAQLQTYEWGFQASFAGGFGLTSAAIVLTLHAATHAQRRLQITFLVLAAVCAALAELSFQGGLLAWPASVGLALLLKVERRNVAVFATVGVAAIALYFVGYARPPFASSPLEALGQPLAVGSYLLAYLGNPFGVWPTGVAVALGAVSLALFALALARLRPRAARPALLALAVVATFALAEGLLRASQRADFPAGHATGTAFAAGPAVFWSAVVALLWLTPAWRPRLQLAGNVAVPAAVAVVVVAAAWSWTVIPGQFDDANDSYRATEDALLAGVYDQQALSAIYPPESLDELIALVPFLRREGYSIFAGDDAGELIGQLASDAFVYTTPELCLGFFDTRLPAAGAAGEQVNGWSWVPRSRSSFRRVVLVSAAGRIVGLASGGYPRPDVPRDNRRIDSDLVGWRGYALPGQGELRALGVFGDGGACELQGRPGPP